MAQLMKINTYGIFGICDSNRYALFYNFFIILRLTQQGSRKLREIWSISKLKRPISKNTHQACSKIKNQKGSDRAKIKILTEEIAEIIE